MDEVRLRRYRNSLIISGTGVIAFGVWSVIKLILIVTLKFDDFHAALDGLGEMSSRVIRIIIYTVLAILLIIDLSLRLFVGLSARSEGFGRKKRYVYIGIAILMLLFSVWSTVIGFDPGDYDSVLDMAVSLLVELTSDLALLEIVISAFRVKSLTKKAREV